ncbi:hypothetical protein T484DRAFT_1657073 [Baffinella frigidus]|nr:hypothetical protein T484DRAFT_1657073 [Cryptophyta sp. CCMP2293]
MPAGVRVQVVDSEMDLFRALARLMRRLDPDFLVGYEVQKNSWGYVLERGAKLGFPIEACLSRCPLHKSLKEFRNGKDTYGQQQVSGVHVCGREVLNVWRLCRGEVKLQDYSFPSVCAKVLNKRVPTYSHRSLHAWFEGTANPASHPVAGEIVPQGGFSAAAAAPDSFKDPLPLSAAGAEGGAAGGGVGRAGAAPGRSGVVVGRMKNRRRVLRHLLARAGDTVLLLDAVQLVDRTCELARVFGMDFFSVLSRGSQFRVESMMYRLARPQNYALLSPSVQDRQSQRAMESIPLVLEPQAINPYYTAPVCVLDFRSLYPSVIPSPFLPLGPTIWIARRERLGAGRLDRPGGMLAALGDRSFKAPNGVAYVNAEIREGVVPRMLREILQARVAVKKLMKQADADGDRRLYRTLNSRQFGLKLIANVTYGYTAAGFSGRMPCAELADSIVQTAREFLERAMSIAESPEWGGKVVYGDTDSLFVEFKGKSRAEAWRLGREIAAAVAREAPAPMELELEKVYQPCICVAKKRYVGYMYEHENQAVPVLDAKGIEMVRRDQCPLVAHTQEKCLRILFETGDLSKVRRYLESVWTAVATVRVNVSELVFWKEVRLGTYKAATKPPAATVNLAKSAGDERRQALYAERVPYLVVCGESKRLVDLVVDPWDYLASNGRLRINAHYYIAKALIPPMERLLRDCLGADVRRWYMEQPRIQRLAFSLSSFAASLAVSAKSLGEMHKAAGIRRHLLDKHCFLCDRLGGTAICAECLAEPQAAAFALVSRRRGVEEKVRRLQALCAHCTGWAEGAGACQAVDCALLYTRVLLEQDARKAGALGWGLHLF